ncbi:MAG: hypothetical protein U5L45_25640 [Saprospiraceae bacterium]|nr:hypothetical protein [Saprospiraceae bacterium]
MSFKYSRILDAPALLAQKKWFIFRLRRKMNHKLSPSRERSERETNPLLSAHTF